MSRKKKNSNNFDPWKVLLIALAVLFVGSIIYSFITETLMPLVDAGDPGAVGRNLVGFPIILLGTAIFVYGGFIFVRDTFGAMGQPEMKANVAEIRAGEGSRQEIRSSRWQNFLMLLRAWKDGALRMALGFGLIAVGGWLINL